MSDTSNTTLIGLVESEVLDIVSPLVSAVEDPYWSNLLFSQLGVETDDASTPGIITALQAVLALQTAVSATAQNPEPSFAGVALLLKSAKDVFTSISALSESNGVFAALTGLGDDLVQLLLAYHVATNYPLLYDILVLLTLIQPPEDMTPTAPVYASDGTTLLRAPAVFPTFQLQNLSPLLKDPVSLLSTAYVNNLATVDDANAMADKLFPRLAAICKDLKVLHRYGIAAADVPLLGAAAPLVDHSLLVYLQSASAGATADAGVCLAFSSTDSGGLGLVVSPFGELTYTQQCGAWTVELGASIEVDAFAYGHNGFVIAASVDTTEIDLSVSASLGGPNNLPGTTPGTTAGTTGSGSSSTTPTPPAPPTTAPASTGGTPNTPPAFIFGSPTGSRLQIGGALLEAEANLTVPTQTVSISAAVSSSALVISPGDGDSFLQSILPAGGITANFDFGIAYSTTQGITFKGAAGLSATFTVGLSLGGAIKVPTVYLGLSVDDSGVALEISAAIGATIGPVSVLVDRLGVLTTLAFPPDGGSLAAADLDYAFKPPSGAGLSIDAAGVTGGGFLEFDFTKQQYSGVLSLAFSRFALQAFGLITTGEAGTSYSILALIDADFPPMQLGWGFTLNGVGGLMAVNRSASDDALGAAVKTGQVSTILFPTNPITNAPQVLSELQTLFPAAPGRFIFGPMALLGWGTPTVLTASIAVVIELPEPIEIILLARVNALLPDPVVPLVKINMDAVGILDLSASELSLDASLFDSKLVSFTLSGDMALRAVWSGPQREFLLAIGGFHPQFTPPTGFPTLRRLAIDMSSHSIAKLHLDAYLAITSNTIQFGSDLDLFIGVSGFGLAGHLGFDALLQLSPFHFDADISGSLALMGGGDDLTSISVQATLSGPAPWNIAGSFKVHIIFFDVSKSFSVTWGADAPSEQIAAVDVSQLISTSLIDPRNWESQLPYGMSPLVSTQANGDQTSIMAYPSSNLEVHQRIAPLDLTIACFGGAPISGATNFAITAFSIGGTSVSLVTIQDDFAPAQFFQLTDEEKLARPSYELHDAGIQTDQNLLTTGASIIKAIQYETFYIDTANGAVREDPGVPVSPLPYGDLQATLLLGAAGKSIFRTSGSNRFTAPGNPVVVTPPVFVMVDSTTLTAAATSPTTGLVYSNVQALMDQAIAANPALRPNLEIVATHEMVPA